MKSFSTWRRGWFAVALLLGVNVSAAAQTTVAESTVDGGRFGAIHVYRPNQPLSGVVLFLSGDGGWRGGVIDLARRLAGEGYLVGGIDVRSYLAAIAPRANTRMPDGACVSFAQDIAGLSQQFQHALGLPEYTRPLLFGYSAGAAVAYGALAQAPARLFVGGVSLAFCPEMDFDGARLCAGAGLHYAPAPHNDPGEHEIVMTPDPHLVHSWTVVHGDRDNVCDAPAAKTFAAAIPSARLISLPQAGHELQGADSWWPRLRSNYQAMQVADRSPQTVAVIDVQDLPVTEVPATGNGHDVFAVLISGDGGWAQLDQDLSAELARRGIPVAGLNSLRYFWRARTPESAAVDVGHLIEHYAAQWHKTRVLLIGYSFGADVLPSVVNRLPAIARARVVSVSLLGLGPRATYEVTAGEWLPGMSSKGTLILPEIEKLGATPLLCVQGEGEKDTLCPELQKRGALVRQIGEKHHFSYRAVDIADAIYKAAGMAPVAAP